MGHTTKLPNICPQNKGKDQSIQYIVYTRIQQLAYVTYIYMPIFIGECIILGMRMLARILIFSVWSFKVFKKFSGSYNFILFKNSLLYI